MFKYQPYNLSRLTCHSVPLKETKANSFNSLISISNEIGREMRVLEEIFVIGIIFSK
jgi:hypothetical protein